MSDESVLLKYGWRTDAFWTLPVVYKSFLKYIPLYFDTKALLKSQYWPRERIGKLQEERLRELFVYACRVPYWKKILEHASGEPRVVLSALPITSKKELIAQSLETIADQSGIARSDEDSTSGSTGRPFHFYFDWHASLRSFAITERIFRTAGKGKRYPIVYMRARERN